MKKYKCIKHQDGWCAAAPGADVDAMSVETVCGHFVTLPIGVERRRPDCPECRAILQRQEKQQKGETQ